MDEGGAGASARREAERSRAKAERLLKRADAFEKGAAGEVATSEALAALPPTYWSFHDLAIEGSRANIDHLVIGPTGVFVIDAKNVKGTLRLGNGTLWRGRYPMRKEVGTLEWEADQVTAALGTPVAPMLCFVRATLPGAVVDIGRVRATTPAHLVSAILSAPPSLTIEQVNATAPNVHHALPPRSTTAPTHGRPKPRHPAAKRRPPKARATAPRRSSRGRRANEPTLAGLAFSVVALAGIVGVLALKPDLVSRALNSPLPPHDAPALAAEFTCPAPGGGWTLQPTWPGPLAADTWYQLEWAPADGAWTMLPEWRDEAAPPTATGLAPGGTTVVRARVADDTGRRADTSEETFTAPAEPC